MSSMTFCNFVVVLDGTCKEGYKNWRGVYEFGRNIEVHWEASQISSNVNLFFNRNMQTIRVRILLSRETDPHRSSRYFCRSTFRAARIRDVETRNRGTRSEARQGLLDRHPRKVFSIVIRERILVTRCSNPQVHHFRLNTEWAEVKFVPCPTKGKAL